MVLIIEEISYEISKQLNKLEQNIQSHNNEGDIYGLFSYHILAATAEWRKEWDVLCDIDWVKTCFEETNVYSISILGFSLQNYSADAEVTIRFIQAFDLLMKRDLCKGSHISLSFQPIPLIGLISGVKVVSNNTWKTVTLKWLSSIINKRIESDNLIGYQAYLYQYAKYLLDGSIYEISQEIKDLSIEELSILAYALKRNIFSAINQKNILLKIRGNLIRKIVKCDITGDVDEKAAFIWISVAESIMTDINSCLLATHYVSAILSRFEDAMKRWSYDSDKRKKPIKWPIESEREVQNILWLILRSYFDDLIDEEALPKFGHKFYKPDFAIPSLRLLIEAKYAYQKENFKKLEQEIMVDANAYLSKTKDYDRIIVFIYDESSSVQEHGITKREMKKLDTIEDVIIVSKPSQIKREGVS